MAVNPRRGVLRHKQLADTEPKDKFEDLLVFGYACKLFRDDEKAIEIDQGKYLIPWMGEETLKIDRYDARGTLFDLKSFETPEGGYERTEGLTAEERHIEKLCDEERYFALYKDEAEEAVIKEEEIKRLNQELNEVTSEEVSYRQVPFSYNDSSENDSKKSLSNEAPVKSTLGELGDAVYVPPPVLDVPPDIVVPPTQKLARIIEKTANFISSQGTQMEIIVKTKQANNPMFQFLHFDCVLHPFYRHVLAAVRNGTYTVPPDEESSESMDKEELDRNGHTGKSDSEDDNYLHPSLQAQVVDRTPSNETTTAADTQDVQPPAEARLLIDKTASYMARNGRNLEALVLSKGDARFTFLNSGHAFHSYYIQKLTVYTELHHDIENKQAALQQSNEKTTNETVVENPSIDHVPVDQEVLKNERRKKATLFLDQIKKDKAAGKASLDEDLVESESTTSTAQKSGSPSEIEIIGSVSGDPRERTRSRTRSRSPSLSHLERKRHVRRRSVSRSRSPTRSRSRSRTKHRSSSRTRRRSRSRSRTRLSRRSPSPERRRRQHKKHRSRDRHKREKKKRRSRERSRKKRRHRSRSLSSESLSRSRSRSRSSIIKSRSPSESRVSPITSAVRKLAAEASKSGSETSSPLPSQLLTVQPAFAKLAEGIRAKVIAMIDGDKK